MACDHGSTINNATVASTAATVFHKQCECTFMTAEPIFKLCRCPSARELCAPLCGGPAVESVRSSAAEIGPLRRGGRATERSEVWEDRQVDNGTWIVLGEQARRGGHHRLVVFGRNSGSIGSCPWSDSAMANLWMQGGLARWPTDLEDPGEDHGKLESPLGHATVFVKVDFCPSFIYSPVIEKQSAIGA